MKHKRIILSVTNDLVTDQRVHRSCTALCEAGYDVTLVGRRLPESVALQRPYRTVRMRLLFRKKAVFYAEYNLRLFLRLLFSRTDAFYANDTDTLPANYLAAVLRRKPLFFDAHEMFPEVPELVGRPRVKRFWTRIEDRIFPKLTRPHCAAATVCQSIADIYQQRYGLKMCVVRNVPMSFPSHNADAERLVAELPADKRILLYQGAVNIGRGIEWIMAAMPYLPDCHLVVAGVGDIFQQLKREAADAKLENVTFLGRVEPSILHCLTSSAALGLSLLENRGLNYYYSFPNRIADFVQAGVPVLATDFPEIRRVVQTYNIGTLVEQAPFDASTQCSMPPDPQFLAQTIRDTLAYWDNLPLDERRSRFEHAAADLNWNNDKKTLLNQVDTIF
ncbi:MAG: glycosyltransferase [Bacteroidales bacterium]|nr:glycosyltransferase [Bacteroidales bacterium]